MTRPSRMGTNRTGIASSPGESRKTREEAERAEPSSRGDEAAIAADRSLFIAYADPIGSVPTQGLRNLRAGRPDALIDKLGERLAFERTGIRLYEALINKCRVRGGSEVGMTLEALERVRSDETRHFHLVRTAIESLGGDATAQTPSADVLGVAAKGLLAILTDPRTSVAQCMSAILLAELADNDGWRLLIRLADELGLPSMAQDFREALRDENHHLALARSWYESMILREAGAEASPGTKPRAA